MMERNARRWGVVERLDDGKAFEGGYLRCCWLVYRYTE